MIYLIDDKRIRQKDNGWSFEKIQNLKNILTPIYSSDELTDKIRNEIFSGSNVILFHESFFDNPENKHRKDVDKIRQDLIEYAYKNKTILVFFSGSIGNRVINDNIAYLPTNILYTNLEAFIDSYIKGVFNISYLVYGDNFRREETLLIKQNIWKIIYDLNEIPKNNIEFKALVLKLNPQLDINTISDLKTLKSILKDI
jgi:hypothetical protein